MPILQREADIYPEDLLESPRLSDPDAGRWWVFYTLSRREKDLMRRLCAKGVSFYGPVVSQRKRTSGRVRTSYVPLFPGYVFVHGDEDARYEALATNCISRCLPVLDSDRLTEDLRRCQRLIQLDASLTPEAKLLPGARVRMRHGRFAGIEGVIIRREGQVRLLVAVDFLQRGASMVVDEADVEPLEETNSGGVVLRPAPSRPN